jgi:hypothetical protein
MNNTMLSFQEFNLPIPETVHSLSEEKQREIYEYLKQLDEHQKKAYIIAFNHLGTSFNIYRSNGFKEWKHKNN